MEEQTYTTDHQELEYLRVLGFSEPEAARLINMKSHMTEEIEYREIVEETHRLAFLRWLIEHDRMTS